MKEALKRALESMKRIDAWLIQRGYTGLMPQEKEVITAIEAALAQLEQEPVEILEKVIKNLEPLLDAKNQSWSKAANMLADILSAAPQRTWVGLTEARIKEIWLNGKDYGDDWLDVLALARAFEAELKELNT